MCGEVTVGCGCVYVCEMNPDMMPELGHFGTADPLLKQRKFDDNELILGIELMTYIVCARETVQVAAGVW